MSTSYPKNILASAAAKVYHVENVKLWMESSTIPTEFNISGSNLKHKSYCFPEFCSTRHQIEMHLLDPTHLLTNMRSHCTRKNLDNCLSNDFLKVSKSDNDILPRAIVSDMLDRQSVSIALKVFSEKVANKMSEFEKEQEMIELKKPEKECKKIVKSSKFINGIWNWYHACDKCGLTPEERLCKMQHFFDILTNNVSFDEYPPPSNYVKGKPLVTYEGILQNITLRFATYKLSKFGTYNQCSLSTLCIENYFGDLTSMEFCGLGCPKSTDILRLMSHVL